MAATSRLPGTTTRQIDPRVTASRVQPNRSYPGGTTDPNAPGGAGLPPSRTPVPEPPAPPLPPPPEPPKPPDPPAPVYPKATGNIESDIISYLRQNFPQAWTKDLTTALPALQSMYPGLDLHNAGQSGKIRLPDGRIIDIGLEFGIGGGKGWWWGEDRPGDVAPAGGDQPATTAASDRPAYTPPVIQQPNFDPTVAGTMSRATSSTSSTNPSRTSSNPQVSANNSAYRQKLLEMMNRGPLDPDELRNSPEFRARQLEGQRGEERGRSALAEQANFEGWADSGAFDTQAAGLRQARGEGDAAFLGGLAERETASRKQELQYAIQVAQADGNFDAEEQFKRELADLDAMLQRERLGFSYDSLQAQINERAALAELGFFG